MPCESSQNQLEIDESKFWDANGIHWEPHRIGWTVAGGCTVITLVISVISVWQHCRNYTNPRQQRQILRILYMPPVYAIISFLSYRFFRYYTYYSFIYIAYEAVTLSAFLLLLIEYVAATATGNSADRAIERKDKRPLPIPFCCWRYRPTKAYFMHSVKWSVLQYIIIRPAASIAGIICEHYHVLCHTEGYTWRYASVYIESVNFVSISIALYGLLVFYGLMAEELKGKRPVAKFLAIKLIVMFTFYQTFMFNALQGRVIKETKYWTTTNIANGLNALAICIEMVFFAILMWWAYTSKEYTRKEGAPPTSIWKPLWDSINWSDFGREIWYSVRWYFNRKPHPDSKRLNDLEPKSSSLPYQPTPPMQYPNQRMSFAEAFGVADYQQHPHHHSDPPNSYPMSKTQREPMHDDSEEWQRLRPSISTTSDTHSPGRLRPPHTTPPPERPVSEGDEVDLGYYETAYAGGENAVHATQVPQYPPQQQQQQQHYHYPEDRYRQNEAYRYAEGSSTLGAGGGGGARDSFQAWTGPRAI